MEDIQKEAEKMAKSMAFAVQFIPAIFKLKKALDAGEGTTLSYDEVSALIEGFRLLKDADKK